MLRRTLGLMIALILCLPALAEGPYCVVEGGVTRLVDADGAEIPLPEGCEEVFPVVPGSLYAAGKPGDYALVDAEGAVVAPGHYGMFDDDGDAILFRKGWRYGAMDREGVTLQGAVWTQLVCDGRGGFLGVAGNAIDEIADELIHISPDGTVAGTGVQVLGLLRRVCEDRLACCGADGLWGYVDGAGRQAIPFEWMSAGDFEDGRAIVAEREGWGVIDARGRVRVATEYVYIARCGVRFAALNREGQLDIYDVDTCDLVASLDGTVTSLAPLGDAVAVTEGARSMLIDGDGHVVSNLSAESSFAAGDLGQYIATDGPWGEENSWIVNADGTAASGRYQILRALCEERYVFGRMNGVSYYSEKLGSVQQSWDYDSLRYGLLDGEGQELLPAEYRLIRALDDERLLLLTDDEVVLADRDGQPVRSWSRSDAEVASDASGE